MIHHKETSRKNEWIKIKNGDKDEIVIDFGNDEVVPTIWVTEGENSKDRDVAMMPIFDLKQVDELILAFKMLKKSCRGRKYKA
jgi:hypothetical protein